jgi:hypothetical protein
MARILGTRACHCFSQLPFFSFKCPLSGLEEGDPKVRGGLTGALRVSDEAVILPSASRSAESGGFKNVVLRLSGTDAELPTDLFSPNWFSGVSLVSVPAEVALPLLKTAEKRRSVLKKLSRVIPSELHNSELSVGPDLDGDADDRDKKKWEAGFDSANCAVGLFSAYENRIPVDGERGTGRAFKRFYLVCKAGGGVAAQTFHARFVAALQAGKTLDDILEGNSSDVGPQALRRVATAGRRNRSRILAIAAEAIGHYTLDTLSDNAGCDGAMQRVAIPEVDVSINTIRRVEGGLVRRVWQYNAGCVDAMLSLGMLTSSNPQDGFSLFTTTNGELKTQVRNEAYNSLPFATRRIKLSRDIAVKMAAALKKNQRHVDEEWLLDHFSWISKPLDGAEKVLPAALCGAYDGENFLSSWGRELGVASLKQTKLLPELVAIGGVEPSKLRAILRSVQQD